MDDDKMFPLAKLSVIVCALFSLYVILYLMWLCHFVVL